jgi:hypothetical protein
MILEEFLPPMKEEDLPDECQTDDKSIVTQVFGLDVLDLR